MTFLKKFFIKIFQFKIYRRIIVSFGLMFIATVSILSCLLFYLFSSSAAREIDNTSKEVLSQLSYASDVVYNQATNIVTQLYYDDATFSLINAKTVDKIVYHKISRKLLDIQSIYPFITSIGVYNFNNGLIYDTLSIPIAASILDKNRITYIDIFPRKVASKFYTREIPYNLITCVIFPEYSMSSSSDVAIVINIDQKYILKTVSNISGAFPEASTFVMDQQGMVISHIDNASFMNDLSKQPYIQEILKGNYSTGSFITKIEGEKHLVTYAKPDIVNWYFVSVRQYDQLLGNLTKLLNTMLLITLILIAIGIIASFMLTSVIYNPIKSLMDKVSNINIGKDVSLHRYDEYRYLSEAFTSTQESARQMTSSIERAAFLIKENYIYNLLKGNMNQFSLPQQIMERVNQHVSSPFYCIIALKIDDFQKLKLELEQQDQNLCKFIVSNIAQELLHRHFKNEVVVTKEDELAVLALLNDTCLPDEIYLTLNEIQDAIRNHYNFTISIFVGDVLNSDDDITESYKLLQEYSKYRLFYGNECVINSEKYNDLASRTGVYPYDIEKNLLNALHLSNKKAAQKCISNFIEYIDKISYYEAVYYTNRIMSSIIKSYSGILDVQEEEIKRYLDIDLIYSSDTLKDISALILELCSIVLRIKEEEISDVNKQRYIKIINEVKQYLEANYSDPNLSLDLAANKVNLSAGYLGKLFKNITSLSFTDYLNTLRLEKAKELLCTTNEPASRICEKVGIYNITYFSTLFKKTYGITPSQFRARK